MKTDPKAEIDFSAENAYRKACSIQPTDWLQHVADAPQFAHMGDWHVAIILDVIYNRNH